MTPTFSCHHYLHEIHWLSRNHGLSRCASPHHHLIFNLPAGTHNSFLCICRRTLIRVDSCSVNDVSNMADSQRNAEHRNTPVPSASTSRRGRKPSTNSVPLAEIFTRADVTPFDLTRDELIRANETPGISWRTFSGKFGGGSRNEWPKCGRIPGYTKFLCADTTAQPYVPMAPGKPGLVLHLPTTMFTPQDDGHMFQVFSSRDGLIHYQGEYARSGLQVEINWDDLSASVSVERLLHDIVCL